MNRRAFLTAASAVPVFAQTSSEPGFTSLFDGKTLEGWTVQDGPETAFYVNNGAIVVHESSGFPAWLVWLVAHIYFLINFRNRLIVMIDWAWAYFTYQRSARIVIGTRKKV